MCSKLQLQTGPNSSAVFRAIENQSKGQGRTYWIYSTDEGSDFYKRKHVLDF